MVVFGHHRLISSIHRKSYLNVAIPSFPDRQYMLKLQTLFSPISLGFREVFMQKVISSIYLASSVEGVCASSGAETFEMYEGAYSMPPSKNVAFYRSRRGLSHEHQSWEIGIS